MTEMTDLLHSGPIKNAAVRRLRATELATALTGGIHQRVASRRTKYPFLTYAQVSAPIREVWGSAGDAGIREIDWLGDFTIWATNPVQAENLLQLVDQAFSGQYADKEIEALMTGGQTVLRCVTSAMLPATGPERDDEGRRIFGVGLTVNILVTQPVPLGTPPGP